MPRGFLVKRTKHSGAISYRVRRNSEDETFNKPEQNPESDTVVTRFGSPDSGYSSSPVNLILREQTTNLDVENNNSSNNSSSNNNNNTNKCEKDFVSFTPPSSPRLTVSTTTSYPSPFYYTSFDKLSVTSNSPNNVNNNHSSSNNNNNKAQQQQQQGQTNNTKSPSQNSPNKRRGQNDADSKSKNLKKSKAARKINFDEDKSSPVSGCIIKDLTEGEVLEGKVVYGDIDSTYNCVEVTPEARAELEKIDNKIGDYVCQLCKEFYNDAFQLAQHRCSRIVHVEYRCPECDKVFSCPANLASHRRWHKPRAIATSKPSNPPRILPASPTLSNIPNLNENNINNLNVSEMSPVKNAADMQSPVRNANILSLTVDDLRSSPADDGGLYECETCGKKFRRQAYLRKHVLNHANDQYASRKLFNKTVNEENLKSKVELFQQNNNNNNINNNNNNNINKEIPCSLCNLSFPSKVTLEKHLKTHTNELYTCKYCSSTFYSSPGLTRHINKCHPSENRQVILLQLPTNVHRPN